jgi:hypothetical protein
MIYAGPKHEINSFLELLKSHDVRKFSEMQVSFGMIWNREVMNTSDAISTLE